MPQIGAESVTRALGRAVDAQARVRQAARQAADEVAQERQAEGPEPEQDERTLTEPEP
jgi:hypothetical protein